MAIKYSKPSPLATVSPVNMGHGLYRQLRVDRDPPSERPKDEDQDQKFFKWMSHGTISIYSLHIYTF